MLHFEGIMSKILKGPAIAQLGLAICYYTFYFQTSVAFLENL